MPGETLARALTAHRSGRLAEAADLYRQILGADPANAEALHYLGVTELQAGRLAEAEALIGRALQTNPRMAEARANLGLVLAEQLRYDDALAQFNTAIALRPDYQEAYYNRGNLLRDTKHHAEALADYDRALSLRPGHAESWNNRGISLVRLRRFGEAIDSYERACALEPARAEFHNNRGAALREVQRYAEALAALEAALALRATYPEALNNSGLVLESLGRYGEAQSFYGRALALRPDYAEAHTNLGLCRLLLGKYQGGWSEYEWRWRNPSLGLTPRAFGKPQWSGEDLRGKRILLHMEQGLGDAILALRYVPLVAARGAEVALEVAPALAPLLGSLAGAPRILRQGDALPETDFHCPLLSLPLGFGTTLETIPAQIPYLAADAAAASGWRERLAPRGEKLVGLCWRGNPDYPKDAERSVAFDVLEPLFEVQGVRFIGLQKELGEAEQARASGLAAFVHPGADFAGTAALVAALDLVITVDTSWGHWAGALGKPVWVLLPFSPHWVWLTGRGDSPWYPSARLFRPAHPAAGWKDVIQEIKAALV